MLPFKVFNSEALTDVSVTVTASLPRPLTPFPLVADAAYKVFRSDIVPVKLSAAVATIFPVV